GAAMSGFDPAGIVDMIALEAELRSPAVGLDRAAPGILDPARGQQNHAAPSRGDSAPVVDVVAEEVDGRAEAIRRDRAAARIADLRMLELDRAVLLGLDAAGI